MLNSKLTTIAVLALGACFLGGCPEDKGPAEKAGEAIDKAVEDAGDAAEDMADDAADAMDDAGDAVKDATDK